MQRPALDQPPPSPFAASLVCFKNQLMNEESLINFAKMFGNLESYPEKDKTKSKIEIFNVANVSPEGDHLKEDDPRVVLQKNNSRWHTDSSYRYFPALSFS